MTKDEAKEFLLWISNQIGTMGMEYLNESHAEKMRTAIDVLYAENQSQLRKVNDELIEIEQGGLMSAT